LDVNLITAPAALRRLTENRSNSPLLIASRSWPRSKADKRTPTAANFWEIIETATAGPTASIVSLKSSSWSGVKLRGF
jgi:hypothetical protein